MIQRWVSAARLEVQKHFRRRIIGYCDLPSAPPIYVPMHYSIKQEARPAGLRRFTEPYTAWK